MPLDVLRSELERLFELEQLRELAERVLGTEPGQLGGGATKGSVAGALVDRCRQEDAVAALCDAVLAAREGVDPRLRQIRDGGDVAAESARVGRSLGPYSLEAELGQGPLSVVYLAHREARRYRLKLLRPAAAMDRTRVQRFFAASRLIGAIDHPGLPHGVVAREVEGRHAVVHDYRDGRPLSDQLEAQQPKKLRHVWAHVRQLLEALAAIHARRMAHGDLRPENVLVVPVEQEEETVLLLDAGAHFLRSPLPTVVGRERSVGFVGPRYVAPEQIRGEPPVPSSDVYAFGAMLYELLSGRTPFRGSDAEMLAGHLSRDPDPLSFVAPRGWVSSDLDELVMALLDKDPSRRPLDADAVLDVLEALAGQSVRRDSSFPEADFSERMRALLEHPTDEVAAGVLEAAIDQGADARTVAEAFRLATEDLPDAPESRGARKRLLTRSGVLYENVVRDPDAAIQSYRLLLDLEPGNAGALAALERIYRRHARYDELVDLLVEQAKQGESSVQRARSFAKLGHLFSTRLGDPDEALVAFTQAFCEDPSDGAVVGEIERLAGAREQAWSEVLSGCGEAVTAERSVEHRAAVLTRMGHWYTEKLVRPDLAAQCFQQVLSQDPANDTALEELGKIYRRAQQWKELSRTLARRSVAAVTPARARELRAEAAQVLEERLHDTAGAIQLYEQILDEDGAHEQAGESLVRLLGAAGQWAAVARVLSQRIEASSGERRLRLLCRLAEVHDEHLEDRDQARAILQGVVAESPDHLDALRRLEQIELRAGDAEGLLANLEKQLRVAVTAEQKLQLLRRIAGLHEQEFHDRAEAARAYERMLEVDSEATEVLERLAQHYLALEDVPSLARTLERQADALEDGPARVAKLIEIGRLHADRTGDVGAALRACEAALALEPNHRQALDLLAALRASAGDDDLAIEAIDALAEQASPESRSLHLHRAVVLLQKRGDIDGVIEHCKQALELNPADQEAAFTLRQVYLERDAPELAAGVLERTIAATANASTGAKLCVELARLLRESLADPGRAEAAAARALERDPTNAAASLLLARLAFDGERFGEAAQHYRRIATRLSECDAAERPQHVRRYVESVARSGSLQDARELADRFSVEAPQDSALQRELCEFFLEHGPAERARELTGQYLDRFGDRLSTRERAAALYRHGEAARQHGDLDAAVAPLEEAAELDRESTLALDALARIHAQQSQWERVSRALHEQLDRVGTAQRLELVLRIGELAATRLHDPESAARCYLDALRERPGDRRILVKLVQLYGEEKDWTRLLEVVTELAESTTDATQRSRYLLTAARVALHELSDPDRARQLLDRVEVAGDAPVTMVEEAILLLRGLEDAAGLQRVYETQIQAAAEARDRDRGLRFADLLADLHLSQLQVEEAIGVYEAAQQMDPYNPQRQETLGELYASDPARYLARAVRTQEQILGQDPYRPEPYRLLYHLYSQVHDEDAGWCVARALSVLHRASADEEAFFRRHQRADSLSLPEPIDESSLRRWVVHPDADPLLTGVFALIQPAVVAARTTSLEEHGYDPAEALVPEQHSWGLVGALQRVASLLRVDLPPLFFDPEVVGVGMPHTDPPCLVLGRAGLSREVSPARAAFVAATHLTSFRPGFAVRYLVPSPVALKAWMLAAIRLVAPRLPIATDLERPTADAYEVLSEHVTGPLLDRLAEPVYRLLQGGVQVDVARWMAGVDHTSDRLGLVLGDDLGIALEVLEVTGDAASVASAYERCGELLRYSVGTPYLALRRRLRIAVGERDAAPEEAALDDLLEPPRRAPPPPPPVRPRRSSSPPSAPKRPKSQPPPPPVRSKPG